MKRVETLSGKNLPRLAVAKPGWPDEPPLEMTGQEIERIRLHRQGSAAYWKFDLNDDGALTYMGRRIVRKDEPSSITPQTVADFTRVCDQTGLSEKLRKD